MSTRGIGGGSAQPLPSGAQLRVLYGVSAIGQVQLSRAGALYTVDAGKSFVPLKIYLSLPSAQTTVIGWGTTLTSPMSNFLINSTVLSSGTFLFPCEETDLTSGNIPSSSFLTITSSAINTGVVILGYVV